MKGRRSLQDLAREVGVSPVLDRQPCLPAPSQPTIVASEEDHAQARHLLVEQRRINPDFKDPSKQLKRIFKSSKEKEKLQDPNLWEFTQVELDQALSGIIDKPTSSSGLVQAFLSLGAKVNFIDLTDKKGKANRAPNAADRRRSTVLQRAATTRRADSVSLLASSGADQTTLDEGLKAALAAYDRSCVQELLRHGADLDKFPNALADAIRSNDLDFVRLLLRAPKAIRPDVISSCLPAAVLLKSEPIISLLIGHGADPNFNEASALDTAIAQREYRVAVALVAGPICVTQQSLEKLVSFVVTLPSAQDLYRFLQLLFCCGLSPANRSLPSLLGVASKRNDNLVAQMLLSYGVSTDLNEAECLRTAIAHSNWKLVDAILDTSISPAQASMALAIVPADTPKPERLHVVGALVSQGASGQPLERWLIRAVEDGDSTLMDLLLQAGVPGGSGKNRAIQAAVARKDLRSLQSLLKSRPSPQSLAEVFPFVSSAYSAVERLETVRLLLSHGAHGPEVDQALINATSNTSSTRDVALITELVRHGANVDFGNGKAISDTVAQADLSILRLLCGADPSIQTTSAALPLTFDAKGGRLSTTLPMLDVLLRHGVMQGPAIQSLQMAITGGPENLDIIRRLIAADARLIGPAFQHTITLNNTQKKIPLVKMFLAENLLQEALDQALCVEIHQVAVHHDKTVLQLLLEHGASANYNGGEPCSVGVASGNASLVRLLLNGTKKPSQSSVNSAFRTLFRDLSTPKGRAGNSNRVDIANELLLHGVDQPAIDSALRAEVDSANPIENIEPMTDLLLKHGANVNTADGSCFVFAAKRNDYRLFERLLQQHTDFSTVIPTLISSGLDESVLVSLLELCFNNGCTSDDLATTERQLYGMPALILGLRRYPRCESLIKTLLFHGCNPDIINPGIADAATGEETLPTIAWALAQPQKVISTPVIVALLDSGASPTRSAPVSQMAPISLAAREGRFELVRALLERGADPSVRDKWNRSALFYASSGSVSSVVEALAGPALKNDGSLHEAARCLQLDIATILVKNGHYANFPSRLHEGRNALGELCLNAEVTNGNQRTRIRQLIRLFLDNGANAEFKARNERSAVVLALDNPYGALEVAEALLETEVWENLNNETHMFRDDSGTWYSPLRYVELISSPSRVHCRKDLIDLLRDKGCEPKYYSEAAEQPSNAIGMPAPIARLVDRQKEHRLSLKIAQEASEHARMLEEATHRDDLRRRQEQQNAELAAASRSAAHHQSLEQQRHNSEIQRVREAEQMKRAEKVTWHGLLQQQERDSAAQRQQINDRKASAAYVVESKLIEARQKEVEHRAGVERRGLKEKEDLYERNVKRQMQITQRVDESAQLHARLRQEKPAIEGAQWGSVD